MVGTQVHMSSSATVATVGASIGDILGSVHVHGASAALA